MTEIKTEDTLLVALQNAARHELTEDELRKQRVSFVMGSVSKGNDVTRAQVERILDRQDGRKRA